MQKSQDGLLRSLLFEVFVKSPSLVDKVYPARWQENHEFKGVMDVAQWTHRELLDTFRRLLNMRDFGLRFCFFIDGLDEYAGDHSELVKLLQGMPLSSDIKFCVSSRPWNEFRNVWDQDSRRRLYLEELTENDIRIYVLTTLEGNAAFQEMQRESSGDRKKGCDELVHEIVGKARGVFLWVFLVVRSLLRGVSNADSIADLQNRVHELPSELEAYFKHFLNSIEDRYRAQSCQLFQIALAAQHHSMLLITYSFLLYDNDSISNSNIGDSTCGDDDLIRMPDQPLLDAALTARVTRTRKRINARCRDLLDVNNTFSNNDFTTWRVEFLHRSVRDFLELDEMRTLLAERATMTTAAAEGFNVNLVLFRALLATLKVMPSTLDPFLRGTGGTGGWLSSSSMRWRVRSCWIRQEPTTVLTAATALERETEIQPNMLWYTVYTGARSCKETVSKPSSVSHPRTQRCGTAA